MSDRVLPVLLSFVVVCVGTHGLQVAELTGSELPVSPRESLESALADHAAGALLENAAAARPAPAEAATRLAVPSSNLRWVKPDGRRSRPASEPTPLAPSTADVDLVPKAVPFLPADTPAPTPADDRAPTTPELTADARDGPPAIPQVTGSGTVQAAPSLIIEITGPPHINVGSVASFHIFVKNMGVVTAEDVNVQATVPQHVDVVACEPRAVAAGERVLQFGVGDLAAEAVHQIRVDLVPRSTGEVRLHTNVGFSVAASSSVRVGRPQLAVRCDALSTAGLGDLMTFRVIVENTGDGPSENISLVPQVGMAGQTDMSAAGLFNVGTLEPGGTKEIVLRAVAGREGTMQVRIVASDQFGSEAVADTLVHVRPDTLGVRLITPAEARPDEERTYEVRVSNAAGSPAENVRVTCTLPHGFRLTIIEHSVQFAPDFTGMTWQVGTVAAGAMRVLRFKAKAASEGDYTIRAVLESDTLPRPRSTETTIGIRDRLQHHRTASFR